MDHDRQVLIFQMLVEQVAQLRLRADQVDAYRKRAAGKNRAAYLRLRRLVRANRVESNIGKPTRFSQGRTSLGAASYQTPQETAALRPSKLHTIP